MNIDIENLPDDPATLKKMLSQVMSRYQYLEEQFRIAQHKQFGKSTEGHPGQGELFNEAEELVVETEIAELIPFTETGVLCFEGSEPLPNLPPHPAPQHFIVPSNNNAQVNSVPDDTAFALSIPFTKVGVVR